MSSISRRLIFWLAIPLMVLALCGALVHYFNNVAPSVITSDQRLKEAASALMMHVVVAEGRIALDPAANAATALPAAADFDYALRDSQGHLLSGDARVPSVALDASSNQLYSMSRVDGRPMRTLTTRFDTRAGIAFITIADIRAGKNSAARYGFMSTLLWDFVQLDLTLALVWIGIHFGLRPIQKLREEIAERSPLDLRAIADGSVPREIAPLVSTLNRLFATLRAAAQSQQQFIANTAHQLRTPMAGMQAQLEVLASEPAAQPIKHRLLTLQQGIRQLARAANQLLSLARADPTANMATKNQLLDLSSLAGDIVARFIDQALQSNIDLGVEAKPAALTADPSLLDDLLSNLIDNALKYTPAGGRVTVATGTDDNAVFLAVEDSGSGIPERERQRVRQRFYRLPNSAGHGSGLGLAIVEEIARLYGGQLHISSGANGAGTRMYVTFPL